MSGTITDSSGRSFAGVAVTLSGKENREAITDANGAYSFESVEANGFYNVTPALVNYTFSPASRSFSLLGAHTEASFVGAANGARLNPLDTSQFFVRQQYLDFLGREPDEDGFGFWTNELTSCGTDQQCLEVKRINVSAAFFLSIELQQTGFLVYRSYRSAYGNMPGAPVPMRLEANKQKFMADFVQRPRFISAYPTTMMPAEFVDKLFARSEVTSSVTERIEAINEFGSAANSGDIAARARALRRVAENSTLNQREFNRAFVLIAILWLSPPQSN
ncbi:MAG: carboxypeptidase-like regulatory domain-containing protein [Pyrinomonadaceae bacterium]